ncbi:MAG: HNH endonuclease [Cryobacterium sp.]|nr:HNH endonuclease [Cryobacterium sp.]
MARFFGTPDGVKVGDLFIDRRELHDAHVHRPLQAGISGSKQEGADSIVVSGGYVDDQDYGDFIIYTGHGGREAGSTKQTKDQSIDAPGNAGLITSQVEGLPVRVVRGAHKSNPYAPPSGYQYAGLFLVSDWWVEQGVDGFEIVRFRLDRIPEQAHLWTKGEPTPDPAFASSTVSRRIRDSELSRKVKTLYGHHCQLCGSTIPGIGGRYYSEGAHVKPLGRPHLGADALDNLLCLCPNHHTQLDIGGMVILDDFTAAKTSDLKPFAELTFVRDHRLDVANAQYHRRQWGFA